MYISCAWLNVVIATAGVCSFVINMPLRLLILLRIYGSLSMTVYSHEEVWFCDNCLLLAYSWAYICFLSSCGASGLLFYAVFFAYLFSLLEHE